MSQLSLDVLADRVLKLAYLKLPHRITLVEEAGPRQWLLRAFIATGERMFVDGRYYYPSMPGTLVVLFKSSVIGEKFAGIDTEFGVRIESEGVYLLDHDRTVRDGIPAQWVAIFNSMLDTLEKLAK